MTYIQKITEEFFKHYPERTYEKGMIIVFSGELPPGVMYIVTGLVTQYEVSPQGEKVIINTYKPKAFFPMSWAINGGTNEYFFEAQHKTILKVAPPEEVVDFIKDNPAVAIDLLSRVYRGTDGLLRKMAHLMGGSAHSRLLYEMIVCAKRFGENPKDNSYTLAITEAELASRTGLTRETVNREMHKIKQTGLLSSQRGTVIIHDLAKLEGLLGSNL